MKGAFSQIGGMTVYASHDKGCSNDGCREPVIAFVVGRSALYEADVCIVPKCQKHLAELNVGMLRFVIPVKKREDVEEAMARR